ncbi:MAG: TIGR03546 family protein [Endomicrobiaceae bacterium]|nr:TIGR03546 family protein [Endomicrobiaceae bacterium]MDD3729998.1 TIGR03546 family protein [Endomicrobiaceae bacterium]MDD4166154.1 TIGR03546 family protein [Endomicrobiaceae bacterium]
MFVLKIFKKIINLLQSDISPDQIAWGFALGAILGLVPGIFMKTLLFIVIMIFRVNLGSAFLAAALFAIIGLAIDPLLDKIGYVVLVNFDFLNSFYTWLYNLPVVPFTKFNNTVVMGSLITGIVLMVPNGIIAKKMLVYYRKNYKEKVANLKIIKFIDAILGITTVINKTK